MPRYFFDVRDGRQYPDDEGTELADLQSARVEAAGLAARLLGDHPAQFWNDGEWTIEVRDGHDQVVLTIQFTARDA